MFSKVLIANRGEAAVRVIRACRDLGIRTVAVYSEADATCLHVRIADEAVCIGPAATGRSYLNVPHIVQGALMTGAEAIHPGTGFLSESAAFAEICTGYGLNFIGPLPETIWQLGDKARARTVMRDAGLPVMPGSDAPVRSLDDAKALAESLGYPVMLKAVNGGGGKGIRKLQSAQELVAAFPVAQAEATSAFGNPDIYLEKCIEDARHVEVQILGDRHGAIVHLGERDCSLQRRAQKVIEEAPASGLPVEVRDQLCAAAVAGARAANYVNAGTWEFLVDRDDNFYFMEANTRLQVEHPVTEAVTGIDMVRMQLEVASGGHLPWTQDQITIRGHAIECRVTADDPLRNFAPDAGVVSRFDIPGGPGIRVDTHVVAGYEVPPFYDSLLAKVISFGADREEARVRMIRALAEYRIEGLATTVPFHQRLLSDAAFIAQATTTTFVERWLPTADWS
jgi:acetyl-CoA carboxylase biotin carboxylase subunit